MGISLSPLIAPHSPRLKVPYRTGRQPLAEPSACHVGVRDLGGEYALRASNYGWIN